MSELDRLIEQLRGKASPVQKLKLLAGAWRSLRRLAPAERKRLAAEAGFDRAELLLEKLVRRRGRVSPGLLLDALHKARNADPTQLRDLATGLRDPGRRADLLRQGLDGVDRMLFGAPEPEAKAPQPEPEPAEEPVPQPEPEVPLYELRPDPPPAPRVIAAPPPVIVAPPPPPPVVAPPVIATPAAPPTALLDGLLETTGLVRRLRALDRDARAARGLDVDALRRLLAVFPEGWARRRALCSLLRVRVPNGVADAESLIDELPSVVGRRWCASTVVDTWELPGGERDRLSTRYRLFRASGKKNGRSLGGPASTD